MWHHLLAISCIERGIGLAGVEYHNGAGVVLYIYLVGCKIQPVDGHVAVCLVLTLDVYGIMCQWAASKPVRLNSRLPKSGHSDKSKYRRGDLHERRRFAILLPMKFQYWLWQSLLPTFKLFTLNDVSTVHWPWQLAFHAINNLFQQIILE